MALDISTTSSLARAGRYRDIVAAFGCDPSRLAAIRDPDQRLLVASALAFTGHGKAALMLACSEGDRGSTKRRALSELVLGTVARKQADFGTALQHFQLAKRLAHDGAIKDIEAWGQLHFFRIAAEGNRTAELPALLAESRRLVIEAGDPHLTAFLHDSVAVMEGQTGRLEEARRHLDIAESILGRYPHEHIEQSVHVDGFCIAWLECDFKQAAVHVKRARDLGLAGTIFDVNQGHLDLTVGNFSAALLAFERCSNELSAQRLAAYDGLARLFLAVGRITDSEGFNRRSMEARADPALCDYYPVRWAGACAVRLALAKGEWDTAFQLAAHEAHRAVEVHDTSLAVTHVLLQSRALSSGGYRARAGEKLLEAAAMGGPTIRELRGDFYNSGGLSILDSNACLGNLLLARARRIWRHEGNIWSQLAALPRVDENAAVCDFKQSDADQVTAAHALILRRPDTPAVAAAAVLNAVSAAFHLADEPTLFSVEFANIVEALGCESYAQIEATLRHSPRWSTAAASSVTVTSPRHGQARLTCRPSGDPARDVVLGDLLSLFKVVDEVVRSRRAERIRTALWPSADDSHGEWIVASDAMTGLTSTARRIACTTVPVLITGETGTGKEILARAIHAASNRATATFLPFNCSVGPRDMVDAQLFGHRRGAFTGAVEHAPGVIRAAAGGTLFLDEIGESPLEVQPKLLRFLELGEIHPVGESQPVKVDVRVIAATNIDLDAAVSNGRFREDLFYRLNIVRLHLPPLRERRVEIPVFAQHYLAKHAREQNKGDLRLAEETMEYLLLYRWPGNVRQLANEMRRMAALAESDAVLMPEHLSSDILASRRTVPPSERPLDPNEVVVRLDQPMAAATEHLERAMVQYALTACGGRMEETARRLGLSRKGLYLKRVRFGLEPPESHARSA